MLCGSTHCAKYKECQYAIINNPGSTETVEPFDSFGSSTISYNAHTDTVEYHNKTMCSNYSMFSNTVEESKMNDTLDVSVKVTPYVYKDKMDMDFDHPVIIKSVFGYDDLVEIEHDGHKFIIAESELSKAVRLCSHNRW